MRRLITILFMLTIPAGLWAQAADLFISEYIEGTSNNKAIEIFNGTGTDVDLAPYEIWRISNGGDWSEGQSNAVDLQGIVKNGDVWIICNSQANNTIQSVSDSIGSTATFYNGNDAIALAKDGVIIDVIGEEGDDPGSGWDVAGVTNATGEHTLIRKSDVFSGNTDWAASAGTNSDNSEWIVEEQDYFEDLGTHTWIGFGGDLAPMIGVVEGTPRVPTADEDLTVTATVTDDSALVAVRLLYVVNGITQDSLDMSEGADDTFSATIAAATYNDGDRIEYSVAAVDDAGQRTVKSGTPFFAGTTQITLLKAVDSDGVLLFDGYWARTQGTATVANTVFDGSNLNIYLQDNTAGINVFGPGQAAANITVNNNYGVTGVLEQYNGLTEIIPDSTADIVDLGPGDEAEAITINIETLLTEPEAFEGLLVRIANATKVSGDWPEEGNNENLTITDDGGSNELTLRIDQDTDIDGSPEPEYPVAITGIFSQFDFSIPYTEGYQILPRSLEDIDPASSIGDGIAVNPLEFKLHAAYPNPFNPSTTIAFDIPAHLNGKNVQLFVYDILGQKVTTLADRPFKTGSHEITWNGRSGNGIMMASGIYFAVLKAGELGQMTRLMLIK